MREGAGKGAGDVIEGYCHCGRIGWSLAAGPPWLTRCNCSYCRRSGALWAHASPRDVTLHGDPADTIRYVHGEQTLAFVSCRHCGCTTHWEGVDIARHPERGERMAVNAATAEPADIANLRVRRFDGAVSWEFLD